MRQRSRLTPRLLPQQVRLVLRCQQLRLSVPRLFRQLLRGTRLRLHLQLRGLRRLRRQLRRRLRDPVLPRSGREQLRHQGIPAIRQLLLSRAQQQHLQQPLRKRDNLRIAPALVRQVRRRDLAPCPRDPPAGSRLWANGRQCGPVNRFRVVQARRKAYDRRQLRDNTLDNSGPAGPHARDRHLREGIRSALARDVRDKVRVGRVREALAQVALAE